MRLDPAVGAMLVGAEFRFSCSGPAPMYRMNANSVSCIQAEEVEEAEEEELLTLNWQCVGQEPNWEIADPIG